MSFRSSFRDFQLFLNYKEFQRFNEYTLFQQHMDYKRYRQISDFYNTLHQQHKDFSDYRLNYKKYEWHHHYKDCEHHAQTNGKEGGGFGPRGPNRPPPQGGPEIHMKAIGDALHKANGDLNGKIVPKLFVKIVPKLFSKIVPDKTNHFTKIARTRKAKKDVEEKEATEAAKA